MALSLRRAVLCVTLFCLFLTATGAAFAGDDALIVRRAAFDIGSASIKCTVADVDTDTGNIVKVVEAYSRKLDFAEDVARSYDDNLSREIMDKGLEVLKELKLEALNLRATQFSAVGGAVFREARNGRAYFVTIKKEIGISARVVSKQQGAVLNFYSVQQVENVSLRDLLVWDIGGASQEMTVRVESGALAFYIDSMGSVPFKHAVISKIQGKDFNLVLSPNPVSADQVQRALEYVETYATMNTNPMIGKRIRSGLVNIYGIGGVHYYAVPEQIGGREPFYTREDVQAAVEKWTAQPDEAFESEYASSRLTNLILVLGYMNALGIDKVSPLKVNQTEGLLVSPEFWR